MRNIPVHSGHDHGHDAGVLVVLVLLLVLLVVVLLNLVNLARPIYQILARTVFLFTKKSRIGTLSSRWIIHFWYLCFRYVYKARCALYAKGTRVVDLQRYNCRSTTAVPKWYLSWEVPNYTSVYLLFAFLLRIKRTSLYTHNESKGIKSGLFIES